MAQTHKLDPAQGQTLANQMGRLNASLGPGDVIHLAAGFHGAPVITRANEAVVSVLGEPGAIVGKTVLAGAKKWLFQSISFRGVDPAADEKSVNRLVDVSPTSADIIFQSCSFATVDDISGWSPDDWVLKPFNVALMMRGSGCALLNSRIFNVRNALSLSGPGGRAIDNVIEHFGNDAIQFGADGLVISRNVIRQGRHTAREQLHADGMQGYPKANDGVHTGILIENNTVDMTGAAGDYLQGITAFDGRWRDVRVLRNKVVVNAWHGITWFGVDGIEIAGNTVALSPNSNPKLTPWISVDKSKEGRPSSNIRVHDNVCRTYRLPPGTPH
ncbi:hypothetical protein GCM10007036_18740 [Alsobacter metallidurans]|uniref:Right handed beta helix domain-containing protein n=1 Tax=Alsobacter metallidurans TaxID=340221 RepID=A0A917I7C8_9HYPH|nr:right-handed parallel beta-helix repeat-containing protein [Alsobacter metallidurans]GGH17365.1 hypothetical protein GCM10007036_18740 [Alsobacter metallidurans]